MYVYLVISAISIFLADKTRSTFLNIMAGLITIVAGVDWIGRGSAWTYPVIGIAIVAIGLYLLIMVGVDLLKGN